MNKLSIIGKRLFSHCNKSILEHGKYIASGNVSFTSNINNPTCGIRALSFMTSPVLKCDSIGILSKRNDSLICQTCSLHTEGDKELTEFLTDEIAMEVENHKQSKPLRSIRGFEAKHDGAEVSFTKSNNGELITIRFNVNGSIDNDANYEMQEVPDQEKPEQMLSKPSFTVEIDKGTGQSLMLACSFPSAELIGDGQENAEPDVIEIDELSIAKSGEEVDDNVYAMSGSIMDGNLYDMLLNMLEERGIDENVINELVDYSTTYEHKCYVDLLKQLKDFVAC